MPATEEQRSDEAPPRPRPTFEALVGRGMRLVCPRCGTGELYRTITRMHDKCPNCQFVYDRAPGYYLGATYINYGLTALSMTAVFLFCRLVLNIPMQSLIWPAFAWCIMFPILIYRHARAMWLALDCHFDTSVLPNDKRD